MTYTPTPETIRAKMNGYRGRRGPLFAVDEMAIVLEELARLQGEGAALRAALEPFGSGHVWGLVKAWIVTGAPNRVDGLDFAQRLTRYQAAADAALAPRRG